MPAVNFTLIWPDGEQAQYYSPSTVIYQHLEAGTSYSQRDFGERIRQALTLASDRVQERFGYACSAASAELATLETKLKQLHTQKISGEIQVLEFRQ